ncbi:serine/threonine-protein kinase VRK1-like isoform X1 [Diabrotica undecimpunctata]|uniref:serine/threonine-protein kinase VRK1-like isoform X1 n=2 Tax=Diabrotica undecimpunctata TaxID=50387 RepID=UPI003B637BB9
MPRKIYEEDFYSSSTKDDPPKKKSSSGVSNSADFKQGEVVTDISGKKWKLGKTIGIGGFGEIYEASESLARGFKTDYSYVAKVEKHTSGPLFVEINCYLRIGKPHIIEDWKKEHNLKFIGMPHYVASGSCQHNNEKYRFLLLPKYKRDLGQILKEKKVFNIKTVTNICIHIIDVLEYIHSKGYVHSDIKASNIMLGNQTKSKVSNQIIHYAKPCRSRQRNVIQYNATRTLMRSTRNLRPLSAVNYVDDIPYLEEVLDIYERKKSPADFLSDDSAYSSDEMPETENNDLNQVYLVDFGLASKFLQSNGEHKEFSPDERKAHAGTVLFCSRDAHKGIPSRRSDLESLAYNMVYWLTGTLPWIEDLEQPGEVEKKKIRCFRNIKCFLDLCFNNNFPRFVLEYFEYLDKLQFTGSPDYDYCRNILRKAIKLYGYKQDSVLDFDNLEGWGIKKITASNKKIVTHFSFLKTSPLQPLNSNIVFKRPKLRKQGKDVKIQDSMMNWSKILIDPENIIRQARDRTTTEGSDPGVGLTSLDIDSMNPTQEMLNIFNKCMERETSPRYKTESVVPDNVEGYTPAMMSVYAKILERKELEAVMVKSNNDRQVSNRRGCRKGVKRSEKPLEKDVEPKSKPKARKKDSSSQKTKKGRSVPTRRYYRLRG